jgi:hypothetical protein
MLPVFLLLSILSFMQILLGVGGTATPTDVSLAVTRHYGARLCERWSRR